MDGDVSFGEAEISEDAPASTKRRMRQLNKESERMRNILDEVQDKIQQVWDSGHRVKILIDSVARRSTGRERPLDVDAFEEGDKPAAEGDGMEGDGEWVRVRNGINMDTCSAANVMPLAWLPQFEVEPGKSKQRYVGATGKVVNNKGQRTLKWFTNEGQGRSMVFQMTDVNKILACVAQVCDGENDVLFRKDSGMMIPVGDAKISIKPNSNVTHFRRRGNTYAMDAWVKRKGVAKDENKMEVDATSGFTRQGVKA